MKDAAGNAVAAMAHFVGEQKKLFPGEVPMRSTSILMMLLIVYSRGPTYLTHIGKVIGVTAESMCQLSDRLEEKGFAIKERRPENRRKVWLALTPLGFKLTEEIHEILTDEVTTWAWMK